MIEENNKTATNNLIYFENMSEHDFKTKSKDLCKTIIMDQKMIEDMYISKRHKFEELNKKMLEEMKKTDKPEYVEKLSFQVLDTYFELAREEARREYNRRLLKIILG